MSPVLTTKYQNPKMYMPCDGLANCPGGTLPLTPLGVLNCAHFGWSFFPGKQEINSFHCCHMFTEDKGLLQR